MVTEIEGDVFKADVDVLIHGCNCFHTMGGGVAYLVKGYYPEAYDADVNNSHMGDLHKLGTYTQWTGPNIYNEDKQITVVNLYSQYDYNAKEKPFDYNAFKRGIIAILEEFGDKVIGMPMIGCGLGGGNPEVVLDILNEVTGNKNVFVFHLPNEKSLASYKSM